MELALQMHNNNKKSDTVAEAIVRNAVTTVERLLRVEDCGQKALLNRCIDLQTRYFMNHWSIVDIEAERELKDIDQIWELVERIIKYSNLSVTNEIFDVLHKSFISQKQVVNHIPDGLTSMEELVKEVKKFRNIIPSPVYFQVRFKSYRSFIIKMLQKLNKSDLKELMSFHDFFAFKLILMSYKSQKNEAIGDAYSLFNQSIELMISQGYNLLPLKTVGPADEHINQIYAPFVKDYIKNPKMKYEILLPDGSEIDCFSKDEFQRKQEVFQAEYDIQLKVRKNKLYQALHSGFTKDGCEIEGQVTTDELVKGIRSHDKFKRESRGVLDSIFDVSEYKNLEGFCLGEELIDFFYFSQPKVFFNEIIRPE